MWTWSPFLQEDEVADYLEAYARRFHVPVELGSPVVSVRRDLSDGFAVATGWLELSTRRVVVATGPGEPLVPPFASRLDPRIAQLHSDGYRNPASVPEGRIVVVGSGPTAVDIAAELAAAGRHVLLSAPALPPAARSRGLAWVAPVVDADSDELVLVTGEHVRSDGVVWATGHQPRRPWLHLPVPDASGAAIHDHGTPEVPGLAFVGLAEQRSRCAAAV